MRVGARRLIWVKRPLMAGAGMARDGGALCCFIGGYERRVSDIAKAGQTSRPTTTVVEIWIETQYVNAGDVTRLNVGTIECNAMCEHPKFVSAVARRNINHSDSAERLRCRSQ
jgi:hypothetical protein